MPENMSVNDKNYVEKYGEQFLVDKKELEEAHQKFQDMLDAFDKKYPTKHDCTWAISYSGNLIQFSLPVSSEED